MRLLEFIDCFTVDIYTYWIFEFHCIYSLNPETAPELHL